MKKLFKKPAKPSPYTHPEPIDDTLAYSSVPPPSTHQPLPRRPSPPPLPSRSPTGDTFPLRSPALPSSPRSSTPDPYPPLPPSLLPFSDPDYAWAQPGEYAYTSSAPNGHPAPYTGASATTTPSPSTPSDASPLPIAPAAPPATKKRGLFSWTNTAPPASHHGTHTAPAILVPSSYAPPIAPFRPERSAAPNADRDRVRQPEFEVLTYRGEEEPFPMPNFPGTAPAPFGFNSGRKAFFGGGGAKAPEKDRDVTLPLPADPPPGSYLPSPNGTDATVRPGGRQRSDSRAGGKDPYTSSRESQREREQKERERERSPAAGVDKIVFEKEKEKEIRGWVSSIMPSSLGGGGGREKDHEGLSSWESRKSAYASERETRREREKSGLGKADTRKEQMTGMSSWESRRSTKSTRSNKGRDREEARRERDQERERERMHKEAMAKGDAGGEGGPDIVREIGWLTAHASEDWARVLDVCERVKDSEAVAKEAAKAVRKDIKYGDDAAKLSAARLWAIMLRNCGDHFIALTASRKFMDTVDIVAKDSHSPVVRERLKHVLAMAAYTFPAAGESEGRNGHKGGFLALWKKVRPTDAPERGYPFDDSDPMFNPPAQPSKVLPRPTPVPVPSPLSNVQPPQLPKRKQVISPEEDMRRLFEECGLGTWNAQLLHEALAYATPDDVPKNTVMREFYDKCVASHEIITSQLEWAAAQAGRSRELAGPRKPPSQQQQQQSLSPPPVNGLTPTASPPTQIINVLPASPGPNSNSNSRTPSPPSQRPLPVPPQPQFQALPIPQPAEGETLEEKLLATLLSAGDTIASAIGEYDELEKMWISQNEEREVEERSRKETRLDRNAHHYLAPDGTFYTEPYVRLGGGSGSGRHTPSSQPSSRPSSPAPMLRDSQSYQEARRSPTFSPPPHLAHPLPTPPHPALAPPPHHPNGPRRIVRSRSPSPDMHSMGSRTASNGSFPSSGVGGTAGAAAYSRQLSLDSNVTSTVESLADTEDAGSVPSTPVRPSAKALGKRPVKTAADDEDAFNPHDWALQEPAVISTPLQDEEEGDPMDPLKVQLGLVKPVRYAYDAAAEREKQRAMELKQSSRHAVETY